MRILVAGGGSGGHVVPALAVSEELARRGAEVRFAGSTRPEDRRLVEAAGLPFTAVSSGKLRRYVSLRTLAEPFRTLAGYRQSLKLLKAFRPDAVFAKGGYAAVPVMRAARRRHIPIVIHESDVVPGLANRIGARWAAAVAVSFPVDRSAWSVPESVPIVETGNPLRAGVTKGSADRARRRFGLRPGRPLVLVLGGSQGSQALNRAVRQHLPDLLPETQVVHQVGAGNAADAAGAVAGIPKDQAGRYYPEEFFGPELFDLYAAADLIVTRAGAGGLAEAAAVGKPLVIAPHGAGGSGHQAANAAMFADAGAALVVGDEQLEKELGPTVRKLLKDPTRRARMGRAARKLARPDATRAVADLVRRVAEGDRGR